MYLAKDFFKLNDVIFAGDHNMTGGFLRSISKSNVIYSQVYSTG